MRNRRNPFYPDDTDYTTNSPSYYDDLARKQKLLKMLAKKIWEYDEELAKRFLAWDKNLEDFPEEVKLLLQEWLSDGTLDHIINDTIFNWKADKSFVDSEIERLDQKVTSQLRERTVSITEFGAMVDGITDDTKAVQDTVDYVYNTGGGTVFIPRGAGNGTRITEPIKWRSGVSLLGVGTSKEHGSGLFQDGELFSAIVNVDGASTGDDWDDPNVWLEDCQFQNFYIDAEKLTHQDSSADGKGIFILYMKRALFRDVRIMNTIGTGFGCDFLVDSVFDSCVAENCGRNWTTGGVGQSGFGIGTGALEIENVIVTNCTARDCGNYGFFVETQNNVRGIKSKGAKFIGCHAENNRINFGNKGSGATQFDTLTIHGGTIGIQLTEGSHGDRINNVIIEETAQQGIFISNDYLGDLQVSNVTIDGCRKNIEFIGGKSVLENISFTDVVIKGSQYAGMEVRRPMKFFKLKGVQFINNGKSDTGGFRQGLMLADNVENFEFDGVLYADTQEVKTQVLGLQQLDSCLLKNGVITNHDVSGYTLANGLNVIESQLNEVVLKNNVGYNRVETGSDTFNPNFNYISITFTTPFPKPPMVQITLDGDTEIYATNITRFGFFARVRESSEVSFNWTAEY